MTIFPLPRPFPGVATPGAAEDGGPLAECVEFQSVLCDRSVRRRQGCMAACEKLPAKRLALPRGWQRMQAIRREQRLVGILAAASAPIPPGDDDDALQRAGIV